ncbi:hypothetical protein [Streptomyces sp. NPDC001422]|uniref:hypothetical protein n=1 Tax=Streptomyces sp. NPDC001422 TaxID=3364575 RepID=UPI0036829511
MNTRDVRETHLTINGAKIHIRTNRVAGQPDEKFEAEHTKRVRDAIATARLSEYPEDVWPRDSPEWQELVKSSLPKLPSYTKLVKSHPKLTYHKTVPDRLRKYHETIEERNIVMAQKVIESVTCDACTVMGLGEDVPAVGKLAVGGREFDLCDPHNTNFVGWIFEAFGVKSSAKAA